MQASQRGQAADIDIFVRPRSPHSTLNGSFAATDGPRVSFIIGRGTLAGGRERPAGKVSGREV
jgi:hypothetical protein